MRLSMRSWLFGFFIFIVSSTFTLSGADGSKEFSQQLSSAQKKLLNEFFVTLADSSAGSVLYGDKPMSIDTYALSSYGILCHPDRQVVILMKGKELWDSLQISGEKEYFVSIFEKDSKCHVVCINRKAFMQKVKENITLFKYTLGPSLTAENLLNGLVTAKSRFYEVLSENQVLLDILQGDGPQNSLVQVRLNSISDPKCLGQFDEFPLISKKMAKNWASCPEKYQTQPSFGYSSISHEEVALRNLLVESGKLKSLNPSGFDAEEVKGYSPERDQVRAKISKAISSKTFFEDMLRKFFAENAQVISLPTISKEINTSLFANKEEITRKTIQIIQSKIASEPTGIKKFQAAFIQGVVAREKDKQKATQTKISRNTQLIQHELQACKNLEQANAYFAKLGADGKFVALIPNELFYKVVKPGKGASITNKTDRVSFQYTFQILGDSHGVDFGIVKGEKLGALIPGVALALIGMQQGEERVVYIHPKYAYGEETFFPPNISIVAQIRLLDSIEGSSDVAILPAQQLEVREYSDLLAKFEVLRGEEYFEQGVEFWDSLKKSGNPIDFQSFQKMFTSYSGEEKEFDQSLQFALDLEYQLLCLKDAT